MAVYAQAPDGCWYQTAGTDGYYSHRKAWKDPIGAALHQQGASWNVSHKCWVPVGKKPGKVSGSSGTTPAPGGVTVGGSTDPPGGSPYLIPGILAGIGVIASIVLIRRRRR